VRETLERELKLDVEPGFELPPLQGAEQIEPREFVSTYHDTPNGSLLRAGITLRRREEGDSSLWQLKLPREGARLELEEPGGPASLPETLAAVLVAHRRHGDPAPIATLRTHRSGFRVVDDGRAVAEATYDAVDILGNGAFAELEVELVDGTEDELEQIGKTLRAAGARTSDGRPKVMRALASTDAPPAPGETVAERTRYVLDRQLRALEAHDPLVRVGGDDEDVHQMRVATRRARAVIRATRSVLDALEPLSDELKWLASALGEVRDLDVLLDTLKQDVEELDDDRRAGEKVLELLGRDREAARARLLDALSSPRYLVLLAHFDAELTALADGRGREPVRPLAAHAFAKLRKKADALGDDPPDEQLHAVRIAAKRARYAAELVQPDGGKKLRRYLDTLKDVQDVIGAHQDAVVAEERLRAAASPTTALATGRLIERRREQRLRSRADYPDALDKALSAGRKVF
jgi:CHAD domain-containing protein